MTLNGLWLEPYVAQVARWLATDRVILAHYDERSIVVDVEIASQLGISDYE